MSTSRVGGAGTSGLARAGDLPLLRGILLALADEYAAARLDHHAQQARVALAWAHLATRCVSRYADVARQLGSEHWMLIVALAESALRAHRPDVAAAVFDAADQPVSTCTGDAANCSSRRRRPHLRVVEGE